MNKKKVAAIVIGALVVALALPTVAFAGSHGGFGGRFAQCQGEGLGAAVMRTQGVLSEVGGRAFVDADGDGVCDRSGSGACGQGGNGSQGFGAGQGGGYGMGHGGKHHQRA